MKLYITIVLCFFMFFGKAQSGIQIEYLPALPNLDSITYEKVNRLGMLFTQYANSRKKLYYYNSPEDSVIVIDLPIVFPDGAQKFISAEMQNNFIVIFYEDSTDFTNSSTDFAISSDYGKNWLFNDICPKGVEPKTVINSNGEFLIKFFYDVTDEYLYYGVNSGMTMISYTPFSLELDLTGIFENKVILFNQDSAKFYHFDISFGPQTVTNLPDSGDAIMEESFIVWNDGIAYLDSTKLLRIWEPISQKWLKEGTPRTTHSPSLIIEGENDLLITTSDSFGVWNASNTNIVWYNYHSFRNLLIFNDTSMFGDGNFYTLDSGKTWNKWWSPFIHKAGDKQFQSFFIQDELHVFEKHIVWKYAQGLGSWKFNVHSNYTDTFEESSIFQLGEKVYAIRYLQNSSQPTLTEYDGNNFVPSSDPINMEDSYRSLNDTLIERKTLNQTEVIGQFNGREFLSHSDIYNVMKDQGASLTIEDDYIYMHSLSNGSGIDEHFLKLYKSTDFGSTWTPQITVGNYTDHSSPGKVYAMADSTGFYGVFLDSDGIIYYHQKKEEEFMVQRKILFENDFDLYQFPFDYITSNQAEAINEFSSVIWKGKVVSLIGRTLVIYDPQRDELEQIFLLCNIQDTRPLNKLFLKGDTIFIATNSEHVVLNMANYVFDDNRIGKVVNPSNRIYYVSGGIMITFDEIQTNPYLELYDLQGRKVFTQSFSGELDRVYFNMPTQLNFGLYICNIQGVTYKVMNF